MTGQVHRISQKGDRRHINLYSRLVETREIVRVIVFIPGICTTPQKPMLS
jgi:hypothetical protein